MILKLLWIILKAFIVFSLTFVLTLCSGVLGIFFALCYLVFNSNDNKRLKR